MHASLIRFNRVPLIKFRYGYHRQNQNGTTHQLLNHEIASFNERVRYYQSFDELPPHLKKKQTLSSQEIEMINVRIHLLLRLTQIFQLGGAFDILKKKTK